MELLFYSSYFRIPAYSFAIDIILNNKCRELQLTENMHVASQEVQRMTTWKCGLWVLFPD